MAVKSKKLRSEFIIISIFIAIIVFALVYSWWKTHAVIGWTVVGILIIAFIYTLVRHQPFRTLVVTVLKRSGEKIVFEEKASAREPLPDNLRTEVYYRSLQRCENPFCRYKGNIHIHHIDMNNSNNKLFNLIALWPNCHLDAHAGKLVVTQLHNWVSADYKQLLERRKSTQITTA
jgi:hypothetical protein